MEKPSITVVGDDFGEGYDRACDHWEEWLPTEEEIEEILHVSGLDAFHDYDEMGKSGDHWNKFRRKLAKAIMKRLGGGDG